MRRKRILLSVTLVTIPIGALLLFASGRLSGRTRAPQVGSPAIQYIRCAQLQAPLCNALNAVGNRLQKPGMERLAIYGTLTFSVASGAGNEYTIRLITEFPHHLRLEEWVPLGAVQSNPTRIIGFDGRQAWSNAGALTPQELGLIESIVFDLPDHFFIGQMSHLATRPLGKGFRADNGANPNYTGPFYDIYQVFDQTTMAGQSSFRPKLYYFRSDNQRVERVRYQMALVNAPLINPVNVDIRMPIWSSVSGQQLATAIERTENGSSVWTLSLNSSTAILSPRADDGMFSPLSLFCNPCY